MENFSIDTLKRQIGDKLCSLLQSEKGVASGRFCREGEKIAQMIFAEWDDSTTNSFLNVNLAMVLEKVKSLDQWHSVVNSILIKRTFETDVELVNQIRSYIRMIVTDVRENYQNSAFAEEDSRFLFLKVWTYWNTWNVKNAHILHIKHVAATQNEIQTRRPAVQKKRNLLGLSWYSYKQRINAK